jgi:hypothetical protein
MGFLVGGIVALIATTAVVVLVVLHSSRSALDEAKAAGAADSAALPPVADADATVAYLTGEGAPLMRMHDTAIGQLEAGGRDAAACARDEMELTSSLPMDRAVGLITNVPDDALRGLLDRERTALAAVLAACPDGDKVAEDGGTVAEELIRAAALVDLRLDDIGVAR